MKLPKEEKKKNKNDSFDFSLDELNNKKHTNR